MKARLLNYLMLLLMPLVFWAQNTERSLNSEAWSFKKKSDVKWLPAKVPGTVHTDLFNNKIISDPFFGANEKQLQWIENEDWQYQTTFVITKEEMQHQNCELQFDGLDTYADVYLNGVKILSVNNMFRTWKENVKSHLKIGENKLEIQFESAVKKGKGGAQKLPYTLPGEEKIFVRKAQYHFGWDWGPRFVTSGIYKKAVLHFWDNATIANIKTNQKLLNNDLAIIEFTFEIHSVSNLEIQLKINQETQQVELKKGINSITLDYEIKNPKLWWCNGLGEAHLYPIEISLIGSSQILDKKNLNIGLRTIELVQEKDAIGKSFYFKVNGVPVFMKGANYIPPDSFLPRVTDSAYINIVKNAADANMNMLRVWGGGVYAEDAFYDACDKNGILVWQDFMFACAMYPGDPEFLLNVKQEVDDNVNRLKNHPCIALWCGNNESDEGWHNWGWQKQYNYTTTDSTTIWNDYKKLFHQVIPKALERLVPKNENRYWPSSPSIGWGKPESLLQGDSHYWGVWWGKEPFEVYKDKVGRFMSEYGFQGMPNLETIISFTNKEDLNLDSDAIKNHQKHPTGYETINEYMARDYKVPTKFEDYIYVSQLLQAEGIKTAIEAHRRAKPNCMGTLYWQLNDCWPVTSWSSADYYGRWKALHYQAKRSFGNLMISVEEINIGYKIYLVNDDFRDYKGRLTADLIDLNGKVLWHETNMVTLSANDVLGYIMVTKKDLKPFDLKKAVLSVSFADENKLIKKLFYFARPKDLPLTKPTIQIRKIDELSYEVSSDVLAKNVYLSSGQETFFSDNYFDVLPNQNVRITLSKPVETIEAKSLFDTMQ
jgi:beta-mannosidase